MNNTFLYLHICLAIISQVIAIATTLFSLLFLFRQKNIKKRNFELLTPKAYSLESLEKIFSKLLLLGFTLLSFTLISGFAIYSYFHLETKYIEIKILWALLVWFWYFTSIFFRHKYFQSRTMSAQMCATGCLFLLTAWFGFIF